MSELEFLNVDAAARDATPTSPLARALSHADPRFGLSDISLETPKLDVRGDLDAAELDGDVVRFTPTRALVFGGTTHRAALRTRGLFVVDLTGALAGLKLKDELLMRRLTDLDLDALPAAGSFAHVPATVLRDDREIFRAFFPQEYGHYVAEVVIDTAEALEWH